MIRAEHAVAEVDFHGGNVRGVLAVISSWVSHMLAGPVGTLDLSPNTRRSYAILAWPARYAPSKADATELLTDLIGGGGGGHGAVYVSLGREAVQAAHLAILSGHKTDHAAHACTISCIHPACTGRFVSV